MLFLFNFCFEKTLNLQKLQEYFKKNSHLYFTEIHSFKYF